MPIRWLWTMAIGAAACLGACDKVLSSDLTGAQAPATAAHWVSLSDGRRLNLQCSGRGAPTVLFEAGYGATAAAWTSVRLRLARTTRLCAYDRAGSGLSDPGPLPRDGEAIARDLDEALRAEGIGGPYIVVGHSAGGLYGRVFAARRAGEVDGLILLDPTVEHRAEPSADGLDGQRQRARRCQAVAEAVAPQGDPRWKGCIPDNLTAQAFQFARQPGAWLDQLSELDNLFGRTSEEVARARPAIAAIPAYVITASDTAAASYQPDMPRSMWELQHQMLAGSFRTGWQQTVLSSHLIIIDRPEVVAAAVEQMVAASREKRLPEPLPPSEDWGPQRDDPFAPPDAGDAGLTSSQLFRLGREQD
ncbi:MAG: alpha/beta fold hydrolase [Phenylobacterium sp.]|uniref:alpha/beta fold hydrolase n=1 Tax=Phenylobacterium sp. TaxID=1871053 RepID=UPI0025FB4B0D|nr:alpha/beta hydrolase [Phenylobacterium sp.]MBI1198480.1 alpha/beta fold hydrolase [Phenylobacterium sp.]